MALKRGVETGQFINIKGSEASGSFKVNEEEQKAKAAKDPVKKTKTADPANKPKIRKVAAKEKTVLKQAEKTKKSPGKKFPAARRRHLSCQRRPQQTSPCLRKRKKANPRLKNQPTRKSVVSKTRPLIQPPEPPNKEKSSPISPLVR